MFRLALFASNRAAQQSARFYGNRFFSQAPVKNADFFKQELLNKYKGFLMKTEDNDLFAQVEPRRWLNLDMVAKSQAEHALHGSNKLYPPVRDADFFRQQLLERYKGCPIRTENGDLFVHPNSNH